MIFFMLNTVSLICSFSFFVLVWFVVNMRNNKQTVLSKASVSVRRAGGRMRRDATSSPLI